MKIEEAERQAILIFRGHMRIRKSQQRRSRRNSATGGKTRE